MKTVRRNHCNDSTHENESNIDNEWTNFLMGGCEEPPTSTHSTCHDNKYNRNNLKLTDASKKK